MHIPLWDRNRDSPDLKPFFHGLDHVKGNFPVVGALPPGSDLENHLAIRQLLDENLGLGHLEDPGFLVDDILKAVDQSLGDPRKEYSIEHRVVRADGSERIVHERGEVILDADGKPGRMIGTVLDITEHKQTEWALQKALEEGKRYKEQLEAENIYLREEAELKHSPRDIVGLSAPLRQALYRIQQVARSKVTVLLTGKTGTGKGLFARFLHQSSDRNEKPFVNVNCAGLPPNLIQSELFGREKGAFTGSTAKQIGRFELANGGTILLDEIGEFPLDLQAKLLKVIEDGEFERLGSPRPIKVDVRIIASTNRDLEVEIRNGRFRKDLFYRLNVFPLTIPPLRERKEDIPLLVKFYAEKYSKSTGKSIQRISANTMKILEDYSWPGNVRELMHVIERAVILSEGPELRLAESIENLPSGPARERDNGSKRKEEKETLGLVEVERMHILKTLQETGWRVEGAKGAAFLLGMNASTLRTRMKKLGIKRPGN
jgi:formate hydrogenlyase transcriptional activator